MNKKFWLPTLQLIVSGIVVWAAQDLWKSHNEEVKFHVQVNERLAAIETKLGITSKQKETQNVAVYP